MNTNPPESQDPFQLIVFADQHLDATLDRHERGWAPVWEGQLEAGRSIMTLSAGALILSLTVVQVVGDRIESPSVVWLLVTSWVLFAAAATLSVVRQGWSSRARGLRARFEPLRGRIRAQLWSLHEAEDPIAEFDRIIHEAFQEAGADPEKAVKVYDRLGYTSAYCFLLGLIGLLVFTSLNLPF